jgi:putative oxidoreductase
MKTQLIISWVAQLAAAVILLQTLFFKFTGAAESVYIFSTLGVEPWGRLGSGGVELVAAGLLLWPRFAAVGALLGLGVMTGAIGAHLTKLGIEVQGDGGTLFGLALATALCCALVAYLRRAGLLALWTKVAGR